ncbi:MAG: phage holin family protein [Betaproteobacteria bacterium]
MDRFDRTVGARPARRPLAGLVSDLWRESATLIREEAALAKAELSEKVASAGAGVASLAIGGAIVFAGFLLLLFAAVAALAMALPEQYAAWLAPLIVGIAVAVSGAVVLSTGLRKLHAANLVPERSPRSVRLDANIVKEHLT